MKIFRNACPRNCYASCSMLSYVNNGKLVKVAGDDQHGYTKGNLCAKGYAFTQYVTHPNRLKYPIMQSPRSSGNWKRISWEQAYTIIADKIIELNERYGSNLASGYNKFSGNIGLMHYAAEAMFNSIGPHTKPKGNLCLTTGNDALKERFKQFEQSSPEDMAAADLIVIWGANPAVTNIPQMKYIFQARRAGAKVAVIDPVFTETAAKADLYIQIKPGTDGLLALYAAKRIADSSFFDENYAQDCTNNFIQFKRIMEKVPSADKVSELTNAPISAIEELAELYIHAASSVTWIGFGMQRTNIGGENVQAISALAAMTGFLQKKKGKLFYAHDDLEQFPLHLLKFPEQKHSEAQASRAIDINSFAKNALELSDPPLKFLWIASRNPFSQDNNLQSWMKLIQQLELIVTVDLYMTKTAEISDIVLPAATHFEEMDLIVSYWHHWISINEQSLAGYFESKSDLQITRELTNKLNERSPGFSTFPSELEALDWIQKELSPEIQELYGIQDYTDLLSGPHLKKPEKIPAKEKFSFNIPDVSGYLENVKVQKDSLLFPYQLITPQSLLTIHSQYEHLSWLTGTDENSEDTIAEISAIAAEENKLMPEDSIEIFNENGWVDAKVKVNPYLAKNIVLVKQAGKKPINWIIVHQESDQCQETSTHFYDSKVNIRKKKVSRNG
ncbi:molybdopterin-dependent oxidoreductase [Cytobacillus gottheilii]|uniref:Molybdopterin-dependent oxidoreductase n=1 Tax=Cytobacillus gottheilii TaxID=859144 RepID=A0ABX8F8C7_9BACI|nr:molybdopterin-dependent oxidoreductase [Cytobacillus gottheilii]QVY60614.1 molybdopterin-dependent oxidoreductase [Cytobacillus gottheilii]